LTTTGAACGSGGSTSPGGSDTQIQYNNAGAFGADSLFSFSSSTDKTLYVGDSNYTSAPTVAIDANTSNDEAGIYLQNTADDGDMTLSAGNGRTYWRLENNNFGDAIEIGHDLVGGNASIGFKYSSTTAEAYWDVHNVSSTNKTFTAPNESGTLAFASTTAPTAGHCASWFDAYTLQDAGAACGSGGGGATTTINSVNGPTFTFVSANPSLTVATSSGTITLTVPTTTIQGLISLTTTGSSGAATYSGGALNIPQYQAAGSYVTNAYASSTFPSFTYASSTFPSFTYGTSTYVNYSYASTTFPSFTYASNTFQTVLTNPDTGTGTKGQAAYFTGSTALASAASLLNDGTVVGVNATTSGVALEVKGISGNNAALVVASSSGTTLFQITPAGIASTTNVNISALGTCSNGLVTTAGGSVACNGAAFLTGNQTITLTGAITGSGATSIATVFNPSAFATGTSGTIFNIATTTTGLTINLPTASASNTGQLSATDWSTFNGKQNALSGGTIGFNTIWTSSSAIGVGKLIDNGTVIGMNATSSTIGFDIQGTAGTNAIFNLASSSSASILRVLSSGSIDIGTTTQSTTILYVQGTSTAPTLDLFNVASSSGASDFVIKANGNVGIGSSSPSALFTVDSGTATGTASSTIIVSQKMQIDTFNSAGSRVCMSIVGTTLTINSGACP
jgi:hypothetical protein